MKNNKILSIAVVLLLLVNIALVVFMVKGKKRAPHRKEGKEPFEMMVKELEMTEQQQTDYKAQKDEHFKSLRPVIDSLRSARTAYFDLVKDPVVNDSLAEKYNRIILDQQATINKMTLAHFRSVRNIFTPAQQPKFDEFIKKMVQRKRDSSGRK
jgi:Spy/CpxP family protein refolding chaperone